MSYGPPPGTPPPPPGGGYGPPPPGGYPSGGYPGGSPGGPPPDNGLTMAIVAIFCCWPFAIPAIINANKVNDLWNRGDYNGAHEARAQAKKWTKVAFILGIAWVVVWTVIVLAMVIAGASMEATYDPYGYVVGW